MTGWPIPVVQTAETYAALVIIILVRYAMIAGLIHYLLWIRKPEDVKAIRLSKRVPARKTIIHEIKLSTISSFIYAAPGAILIEMWKLGGTAIYSGPVNTIGGWAYVVFSSLVYLFAHDTYFYWTHRWMHRREVFGWAHAGHHKSIQPTPWASFSFDPAEALIAAWFLPFLALFIPIHVGVVLILLMIMTMNAVFNHAGWEIYPKSWLDGWFGRVMITANAS